MRGVRMARVNSMTFIPRRWQSFCATGEQNNTRKCWNTHQQHRDDEPVTKVVMCPLKKWTAIRNSGLGDAQFGDTSVPGTEPCPALPVPAGTCAEAQCWEHWMLITLQGGHVLVHSSGASVHWVTLKEEMHFLISRKKNQPKTDSARTSQLHHTEGCLKSLFRFHQLHQCHAAVTDVVQTVHNMVCNGLYRTIFHIEQQCKQQLSLDSMNSPGVTFIIWNNHHYIFLLNQTLFLNNFPHRLGVSDSVLLKMTVTLKVFLGSGKCCPSAGPSTLPSM